MTDYVWTPNTSYVANAQVTRLANAHGISSLAELRAQSVADIGWYWDAVVRDLEISFRKPYSTVVDISRGIEHAEWFVDGTLNIVDACIERWLTDRQSASRAAIVHEAEDGTTRTWSYAELDDQVRQAAGGLRRLGIGKGDPVGLFLPMIPEAIVAFYALARIGAIIVPLFSGFASSAIASRLHDAGAKAVIAADGTIRRGRTISMTSQLDEALVSCPTIECVVVVDNLRNSPPRTRLAHEVTWESILGDSDDPDEAEQMTAQEPLLLAYTSGTTGRPKGAVHTHAGFLVKTASEVAYSFDFGPGGVFCWITDMGWIMGPLSITGTHANGGTLVLYEGSPDVPNLERLWKLVERHRITMLGVSPTLIRSVRAGGEDSASRYELSSVHSIGSTGEPWDADSYEWLARVVFGGFVPIINFSGGTEVGGSFLAPYPVEPIRSCSLGGPSLGMDVDVVDDQARSLRGEVGELVCRQPWPSMTRGIWNDEARYLDAYWSTFPGIWRHGDYALIEPDGQWFILGRSDDVMNVAGKRIAPGEIESILATHKGVADVAVVGLPNAQKGESIWVFWVPTPAASSDISDELRTLVTQQLGKPFEPAKVITVPALPKTRSGKTMHKAIRAAAMDADAGDLSGAANPQSVNDIRAATRAHTRLTP